MNTVCPDYLNQPLTIGNRQIGKRLVLAPMSKLGNPAFRELLSQYGGYGLLFSEMCNSRAVPQGGSAAEVCGFVWRPEELPMLVCQIFGNEPERMAAAAERIEREGFFGVDINFGCCASSVCRKNFGAAILKDPDLAVQIVSAVRDAVSIPLFVKYRVGWADDPKPAVDLARRFEDAGADALTFHPRVAPDRRTRPPKWSYIALIKDAVRIPVLGNGNVFDGNGCEQMVRTTGCDGVALGRIAIARPWIFAELTGTIEPDPTTIYHDCATELIRLMLKHFSPGLALKRFIRFFQYFAANFRFGHVLFRDIRQAETLDEVEEILDRFFQNSPEICSFPNISLFR